MKLGLLFLSLCSCFFAFAQSSDLDGEEVLRELKNGEAILLVRLDEQSKALETLRRKGHHRKANELEAETKRTNLNILLTFNALFDYCDYRFFYSGETSRIQRGVNRNIFLNDQLELDPSISYPIGQKFYIVDLGHVPLENFDGGTEGLVVLDRWLKPLPDPFPYYVPKRTGLFLVARSDMELVEIFLKNLRAAEAKLD